MMRRSGLWLVLMLIVACGRVRYADDVYPRGLDSGMDAAMDAAVDAPDDVPPLVTSATCGDGVVEGDEVCDDGNTEGGDGCAATCDAREICGDGVVSGEECDDGNGADGDGCDNDCTFSCTADAECDDTEACNGTETCVDNACAVGTMLADGTTCGMSRACRSAVCAPVSCGDAVVDVGEQCDDGNVVERDGCDNDCTFSCVADTDCDDGNGCTRDTCGTANVCEMPIVAVNGTSCDRDGDPTTADLCLGGACLRSICGDGYVDVAEREECDDGNTINDDGCDADCTLTCETDIECDDGNECTVAESCDLGTNTCRVGGLAMEGTACGAGRICSRGICRDIMIFDSGMPDSSIFDSGPGDAGACPALPDPDMPLSCFKECASDTDCVYAQSACCCSCANGGSSEAINAAYMSTWNIRRSRMCIGVDCRGFSCLSVYLCGGPPTCSGGQCTGGSGSTS